MSYIATGATTEETIRLMKKAREAQKVAEEAAAREQLKKPVLTEEDANKRNEAERKLKLAQTRDWRGGAPDSKLKREAVKKMTEMEQRRAEGYVSESAGGTSYLILGGAAVVLFLILRKKNGKK